MLVYHPKTKQDWALVERNTSLRMTLCDANYSEKFPEIPEHQIEQARRISHPVHQKHINKSAT